MSELLASVTLRKNGGGEGKGSEVLAGKTVALYFSAHWCPPCRLFTPTLKDFYNELDGDLEIVFVSFDRTEEDLNKYLAEAHGEWYYIPFGDKHIQELAEKYGVSGIPALIVIKANGEAITKNGRSDVQGNKAPPQVLAGWKSA